MKAFFVFLFTCCLSFKAIAHPHIWIEASVTTNFDAEQNITSLVEYWAFDEIFSATLIEMEDINKNNKLDENEIQAIKEKSFDTLAESNFYTRIFVNKKLEYFEEPTNFKAEIKDGVVIYSFEIKLEKPVNPFEKTLDIGIYDEEYFIEFLYSNTPLTTIGLTNKECKPLVFEDETHPIYFDLVNPATLKVCE